MHELSIARSLVRVTEDAAREAGAVRVTAVYLQLGGLAGVVREALEFAYDFATLGTLLEGSRLVVEPIEILVHCDVCDRDIVPPGPQQLRCPDCEVPTPNILRGRELMIRAFDYDDAHGAPDPLEPSAETPQGNPRVATQPAPTT